MSSSPPYAGQLSRQVGTLSVGRTMLRRATPFIVVAVLLWQITHPL